MVPPPWLELTTSEPSFSATRVSPPGTMVTWSLPGQHERPQIDVARREAGRGAGRAGRQRQRRLGDEAFGLALELVAERLDRRLGRGGADQHAVAAGAVDFLDHQFAEIVEHVGQILRLAAAPGRHVLQDRLFAEIEFHDLRHVGIDRLVVGDAGADRVGQRDVAGRIGRHQPGHAERRIRAEGQGIEEIVVDAAVDHVDALQALGGAHEHLVVLDDEVAALDQFDAQLVGQEGVFVIGGIVDAGRQQRDRRLRRGRERRHRAQRRQQFVGIFFHRRDAVAGEQVRKQPHHDFAVFQHVGHARGVRALSSSTMKLSASTRTMSMPAMWT